MTVNDVTIIGTGPAGLTAASTADELFDAYDAVTPSDTLFQENLRSVLDWLTKHHGFPLRSDDPDGIEYVYSATSPRSKNGLLVMRVSNYRKAMKMLNSGPAKDKA